MGSPVMNERPILLSDAMVRAILDGRKTQTRRVMKPQPEPVPLSDWNKNRDGGPGHWWSSNQVRSMVHVEDKLQAGVKGWEGLAETLCPYGQPGDRLWVRETFQPLFADGVHRATVDWKTGRGYAIRYVATDGREKWIDDDDNNSARCKPSIHMPRWASRILLEITGVRVERVNDITNDDAIAEGAHRRDGKLWSMDWSDVGKPNGLTNVDGTLALATEEFVGYDHPRGAFAAYWEQINGRNAWGANPWVWVIEFKRIVSEVRP
jgi:hypothetical protein